MRYDADAKETKQNKCTREQSREEESSAPLDVVRVADVVSLRLRGRVIQHNSRRHEVHELFGGQLKHVAAAVLPAIAVPEQRARARTHTNVQYRRVENCARVRALKMRCFQAYILQYYRYKARASCKLLY